MTYKQALREEFRYMQDHYSDPADRKRQEIYIAAEALLDELEAAEKRIAELEAREVTPLMFIDGDISPDDAEKLAAIIRDFNEETETPAARMARIIRENPHPTNMCDMPSTDCISGEG